MHRNHGFLLTPTTTDVENKKNHIGRGYLDPVFVSESGMTHLRELRVEDDSYRTIRIGCGRVSKSWDLVSRIRVFLGVDRENIKMFLRFH